MSDNHEVKGALPFFGLVWRALLVGFQGVMIYWLLDTAADVASALEVAQTGAERASAEVGATILVGMVAFFWLGGTVILVTFCLLTRRAKTLVLVDAAAAA